MGEEQTTIDGLTYRLARPFLVIATQNPVEHSGTFPLPESQMDRFMMKARVGYPDRDSERGILRAGNQKAQIENLRPIITASDVTEAQDRIENGVMASEKILDYVLAITEATREHPMIEAGISTRGAMVLLRVAKCAAWMRGRDYVVPEDVKVFALDVLAHRIQPASGSRSGMKPLINSILDETPAP
jgi:MoxR-like ATPase